MCFMSRGSKEVNEYKKSGWVLTPGDFEIVRVG